MEQALARWKLFCGVNITLHGVLESRVIAPKKDFYFTLPFLSLSGIMVMIGDKWYWGTMSIAYTSESLSHYHITMTECGYQLQSTRESFPLFELTEETFENELNPIPLERRKQRDAVMAKYAGAERFTMPRFGNIRWGD